jgi:Lon protease-like protein
VAVGTRRIRINAWLPDDPYPVADIDDWPDVDPDEPGLDVQVAASHARVRAAMALAVELGDLAATDDTEISDDPLLASYHLATLAPIGPADRLRLLSAEGPGARLDLLDEILDDVEAMLKFRLS